MSRIGKQPINIPEGVSLEQSGGFLKASGPKGTLELRIPDGVKLEQEEGQITLKPVARHPSGQRNWGLTRTLVFNLVVGVSQGFSRQLEIHGVGYRAAVNGSKLSLMLGYSHPIELDLPEGVSANIEKNIITVAGADKALVGQVAADIRKLRKPEPYKGKGIRYSDERVRRKAGKAAVKGA